MSWLLASGCTGIMTSDGHGHSLLTMDHGPLPTDVVSTAPVTEYTPLTSPSPLEKTDTPGHPFDVNVTIGSHDGNPQPTDTVLPPDLQAEFAKFRLSPPLQRGPSYKSNKQPHSRRGSVASVTSRDRIRLKDRTNFNNDCEIQKDPDCETTIEVEESRKDADDVDDDASSTDGLPYPGYLPIVFRCLEQTSRPRSWCLKLITWPYPF